MSKANKANGSLNNSINNGLHFSKKSVCITGFVQAANTSSQRLLYNDTAEYYDLMSNGGKILYIASSDAADTEKSVFISGIDTSYNEISETLTTDDTSGQTAVATTQEYAWVNLVYTNDQCAGTISVSHEDDSWTSGVPDTYLLAQVLPTINHHDTGTYAVPAGKELFLYNFKGVINVGETPATSPVADIGVFYSTDGGVEKQLRGSRLTMNEGAPVGLCDLGNKFQWIPEKTILKIKYYNATEANTTISGQLLGYLFDKGKISTYNL